MRIRDRKVDTACAICGEAFIARATGGPYLCNKCRLEEGNRLRKREQKEMSMRDVERYLAEVVRLETAPAWERAEVRR